MCYNEEFNYNNYFLASCYLPLCSHLKFRSFRVPVECKPFLKVKDKKTTNNKKLAKLIEENRRQKEMCDKEISRLNQEIANFKLKLKSRKVKMRLSIDGNKKEIKSTMSDDELRELGLDPATMKKIFEAGLG